MSIIDAKGMACPKPVILTKKELDKGTDQVVETLVDNEIAVQNLKKLAESMKFDYKSENIGENEYRITITKNDEIVSEEKLSGKFTIGIANEFMGGGNDELGKILMKSYLYTVSETEPYPDTLVFYNSGVKLTTTGSESLDELKKLKDAGVEIISCGTCLDFLGLKEELQIGDISNMYTIYEKLAVERSVTIR